KLIGREPIPDQKTFHHTRCRTRWISGINPRFRGLSQRLGQVTHVLLTRSPLHTPPEENAVARLACVKHAASVRPEPGSNSPTKTYLSKKRPGNKHVVTKGKPCIPQDTRG